MSISEPTPKLLSEQQIKAAPESEYMNAEQLEFFRQRLIALHDSTLARIQKAKEQICSPIAASDANDRATTEEQSSIALRIVDREQKLLPKIRQSLERIREGSYGYCIESDEPIGIARLLARPTAEYCTEVKALKELKEHHYRD